LINFLIIKNYLENYTIYIFFILFSLFCF